MIFRQPSTGQQVLPKGCEGRVSTIVETETVPNASVRGYRETIHDVTTQLGCAGLKETLVDVCTGRYVEAASAVSERARRRFQKDALEQSAVALVVVCAECPLGIAYQQRETAEAMRSQPDTLQAQIDAATATQAAAVARAEELRLRIQLHQLQNPGIQQLE